MDSISLSLGLSLSRGLDQNPEITRSGGLDQFSFLLEGGEIEELAGFVFERDEKEV